MKSATGEIELKEGEVLIHEGSESKEIYWLKEGTLAVYKKRGGGDVLIGHVYSGELVGEMSFLDMSARCATVKTVSKCKLIEIPSEKFEEVLDSQPTWFKTLVRTLVDRLRHANAKIKV